MKKIAVLAGVFILACVPAWADSTIGNMQSGGTVQAGDYLPAIRPSQPGQNFKVQLGTAAGQNIGTSGAAIPMLNTANTYSNMQTFLSGDLTAADAVFNGASLLLPIGSTSQRPASPVNGQLRYNSDMPQQVEAYVNGVWTSLTEISSGSSGSLQIAGTTSGAFQVYPGISCPSHKWLNALDATAASTSSDCAQPTPSDINGLAAVASSGSASDIASGTLAGARMPAFTGDASSSAGFTSLTLASVNASPGAYGSASATPQITVDGKGRITSVSAASITPSAIGSPTTTGTGASGTWGINISGNAGTVTTNANLTGPVTSTGNATSIGSAVVTNAMLANPSLTVAGHSISLGGSQSLAASDLSNGTTGSGNIVLGTSPTLTTPNIGTATGNITGNAATVTTIPTLSGQVSNSGNSVSLVNSAVTGQSLTGYSSGAGTITSGDSILSAIDKLNGNITGFIVNLASGVTGTLGISNGGTGAASAWLAMTNLTGNYYVRPGGTDSDIQTAINAGFTAMNGTASSGNAAPHVTVHLSPGSSYTLSNPLTLENEYVNLDCEGAILNASALSSGQYALYVQNQLGPPNSSTTQGASQVNNCTGTGDTAAWNGTNTYAQVAAALTTYNVGGIYVAGTPSVTPTLTAAITSTTATSISVSSATSTPSSAFSIQIDNEIMEVTAGFGTTTWTVVRGYAGTTAATHASAANVVTWHVMNSLISNVKMLDFTYNISFGDSAFFSEVDNFAFSYGLYDVYANPATTTAQAENIAFNHGVLSNGFCLLYAKNQILRFNDTSLDYFENDGLGGSSISHLMDIEGGADVEFKSPHFEFNYGQNSADTNNPIYVNNADATVSVVQGDTIYTGTRPKYWVSMLQSNNSSQTITYRDHILKKTSENTSTNTADDSFATSADSTHVSGSIGRVRLFHSIDNQLTSGLDDFPSVIAYEPGTSWVRNGVGNTYNELAGRSVETGTLAIANQSGSDGTVTPRSGSGQSMTKITGAGTWIITLPVYQPMERNAWGFFLNAAEAGGTITITEQDQSTHAVGNGSGTSMSWTADVRGLANSNGSPYTFPTTGTNQWTRVSWKNVYSNELLNSRVGEFFQIIINTNSMTGTLYLDDFAFSQM